MTHHPGRAAPTGDGDRPVTFDQLDFTTYLYADTKDTSFTEHMILQVNGLEFHGAPVTVPGLGSHFGMYFLIDATGHNIAGVTTFDTMHIALMVDPGNNDGAPSSTISGGATFANGTSGDLTLATGTLVSANIVTDSSGTKHPDFVQNITLTEAGKDLLGGSVHSGSRLEELITTIGGPVMTKVGSDIIQIVNGAGAKGSATGIAHLSPQQTPMTLRLDDLNQGSCGGHWAASTFT